MLAASSRRILFKHVAMETAGYRHPHEAEMKAPRVPRPNVYPGGRSMAAPACAAVVPVNARVTVDQAGYRCEVRGENKLACRCIGCERKAVP